MHVPVAFLLLPNLNLAVDWINWIGKSYEITSWDLCLCWRTDCNIHSRGNGENGIHALFAESDAEFYADEEIEPYSEEFFQETRELETDFIKESKSCQPTCDQQFPVLRERDHNNRPIDHYLQYQPKELTNYVKEFDLQY